MHKYENLSFILFLSLTLWMTLLYVNVIYLCILYNITIKKCYILWVFVTICIYCYLFVIIEDIIKEIALADENRSFQRWLQNKKEMHKCKDLSSAASLCQRSLLMRLYDTTIK